MLIAGVANMMYAHQTYVPAPVQQSAPILSVDRIDTTAHNLELTTLGNSIRQSCGCVQQWHLWVGVRLA